MTFQCNIHGDIWKQCKGVTPIVKVWYLMNPWWILVAIEVEIQLNPSSICFVQVS